MKCSQKCKKDSVTVYNDLPVCAEHWARMSFVDDHKQADEESLIGDFSEDTRNYDDSLIVEDEF